MTRGKRRDPAPSFLEEKWGEDLAALSIKERLQIIQDRLQEDPDE